ncbi:hypothetical protein [Bosea sp. (in: a-proteobacteria)]|uniref:hypothetical protein n=1 Tax=Bosea sp. (in: a-proteobacteria) TaxID=1871050 RepID=UPI0027372046|nr:hypothetical protein [Bosea sp. (in: a-proteobacteria)]MDP3408097.1 hypothetical protein [Bosea sp. (in: a-proteobacteria)]
MSVLAALAAKLWPYALVGVIVLAGWIYVSHLRESLADTTAKLTAAQIEIEAATIRAEVVERQHVTSIAALAAEREAADRRAADMGAAREVVSRSPVADDGPVAPVLRGALDALRRRLH